MEKQDLFSKYMGKLKVEVDEETLELDVQLRDKQKIMATMSEFGQKMTEENLGKLAEIYKEILLRSYPVATPEQIDAFLAKKFENFMTAIAIAFGWTTKTELNKKIEEKKQAATGVGQV